MFAKLKKVKWSKTKLFLLSALIVLFIACTKEAVAEAGMLLPENSSEGSFLYNRYPLDNYELDMVIVSDGIWDTIVQGAGNGVYALIFFITSLFWQISIWSYQVGSFLIEQAFKFDLVNIAVDKIMEGIRSILGVSESGFLTKGLLPELLVISIIILGCYAVYVGVIRREFTKAYSAVLNYALVFAVTVIFALSAGNYLKLTNDISNELSSSILEIGQDILFEDESGGSDDPVDSVKNILFEVQVRNAWINLQFGESIISGDVEERAQAVEELSKKNSEERQKRFEVLQKEIEEYGNVMVTQDGIVMRLGLSCVFMIINIAITFFVSILAVNLIVAQMLFLFFTFFLPINFVIGLMIPGRHMVAYNGLMRVFGYLLVKLEISFVLMITFFMSGFIRNLCSGKPVFFLLVAQLTLFIGIYKSLGEIGEMFGVGGAAKETKEKVTEVKERTKYAVDGVKSKVMQLAFMAKTGIAGKGMPEEKPARSYEEVREEKRRVRYDDRKEHYSYADNAGERARTDNTVQERDVHQKAGIQKIKEKDNDYFKRETNPSDFQETKEDRAAVEHKDKRGSKIQKSENKEKVSYRNKVKEENYRDDMEEGCNQGSAKNKHYQSSLKKTERRGSTKEEWRHHGVDEVSYSTDKKEERDK